MTEKNNKKPKTFICDDVKVEFDSRKFNEAFVVMAKAKKLGKCEFEDYVADELSVSPKTVHSWRFGPGGPGDLETIMEAADILDINYWDVLSAVGEASPKENTEKINSDDTGERITQPLIDWPANEESRIINVDPKDYKTVGGYLVAASKQKPMIGIFSVTAVLTVFTMVMMIINYNIIVHSLSMVAVAAMLNIGSAIWGNANKVDVNLTRGTGVVGIMAFILIGVM